MRIRSKRQAERDAYDEKRERDWQEKLHTARTTGEYHSFGIEPLVGQWVCHRCSAVISDQAIHTAWHEQMAPVTA